MLNLPKNAKQIFIQGPVGQLDCLELLPTNYATPLGIAIIFHPNPLEGGTNTNKIIQTMAKVFTQKGYVCYCPNLRGVGLSDGTHDFGNSEVNDGLAVHNYALERYPGLPLILGGFSFGTKVASGLAAIISYQKLILIGVATTRYTITIPNPDITIVIHGDEDEVIPLIDVLNWSKTQNQAIISCPNTGHFFHGKLVQLQNLLNNFTYST
jgi:uncharacterized protein